MAFDAGAITSKLTLNAAQWTAAIDAAKKDAKSLEGAILKNEAAIRKMGLAMGATGAAMTAVNIKMVMMAASVEESENLFEVSMGSMASSARDWSNQLSKSLGLNQFEIRKTVGVMNVMLNSMGLSADAAFDMSKSLVLLTQDMASFFNIRPEEAFQKIQAGITGEIEPLKRLGILVNETTIQNFALTNGIIKQGEVMTEQQKIMARYGVIMESTRAAQRDLARTIGSTTNQYRILTSRLHELGALLGNALIPVSNLFIRNMNALVGVLIEVAQKFPAATQAVIAFSAALGIALTASGALLIALPGLAAAAVALGTTMTAVASATIIIFIKLAAAIAAVVFVVEKLGGAEAVFWSFGAAANEVLSNLVKITAQWWSVLAKIPGELGKMFGAASKGLEEFSKELAQSADIAAIKMQEAMNAHVGMTDELKQNVDDTANSIKDSLDGIWDGAVGEANKALSDVQSKTKSWITSMQQEFNMMEEAGKRTFNAMADSFSTLFFDVMTGQVKSLKELFADFGTSVLKIIADIMAQWVAMQIITGIGRAFNGVAAVPGQGGYGANTPAGVRDMGSFSKLPSFDKGTDYVPHDMIARVHKGEKILTAEENRNGDSIPISITNVITPEAIAIALRSSPEARNTIINIINRDALAGGTTRRMVLRK